MVFSHLGEGITSTSSRLQRTPLYERHAALGAKLVDFAGWEMPVQYDGVIDEHRRVRNHAGIFDVSHMAELYFEGSGAQTTLDHLATNDVRGLVDGQALYTALCNESGGVRDDVLVYRFAPTRYMMVVNAANRSKITSWACEHLEPNTDLVDRTEEIALLAIQGPASLEVLRASKVLGGLQRSLPELDYYHFVRTGDGDDEILAARTGYTGELGFEVFASPKTACDLWDELLGSGKSLGVGPAGLGARDTLRFEVCYCLYGHELEEDVSPLESGIGWTVKLTKPRFIGKPVLERQKAEGLPRKVIGFEVEERVIARHGYEVYSGERHVGRVTSGTYAPTLERSLGLALVESNAVKESLHVRIRGRDVAIRPVRKPFYKTGSRT